MDIKKFEKLGYEVGIAQHEDDDDQPTVFFISGNGIGLYVSEDDQETIDSLLDKKLHAARIEVQERTEAGELVSLNSDGEVTLAAIEDAGE